MKMKFKRLYQEFTIAETTLIMNLFKRTVIH